MLNAIEKATKQTIEMMELPSTELINNKRIANFKQRITDTLANDDLSLFNQLIEQYQIEHNVPVNEIAAALAQLAQGETPLLIKKKHNVITTEDWQQQGDQSRSRKTKKSSSGKNIQRKHEPVEDGMQRFRIEVGKKHKVKPGNIVGAIANEAGLDSKHMGKISIYENYSTIDLPEGMPKDIFQTLKKTRVAGQKLGISTLDGAGKKPYSSSANKGKTNHHKRKKSKRKAKAKN